MTHPGPALLRLVRTTEPTGADGPRPPTSVQLPPGSGLIDGTRPVAPVSINKSTVEDGFG